VAKPHVLIQFGHAEPHQPGHEKETGAAGEAELVAKIGRALMRRLNDDDRVEARRIPGKFPGDVVDGDWPVDVFIALHGNAAGATAEGYSFGFPPKSSRGKRMADLIGDEFAPFHRSFRRRDNETTNLSGYYGWGLLPGDPAACVVEHGFLTNPAERAWMNDHITELAEAEYRAVLKRLRLKAEDGVAPRAAALPDHDAQFPWFVEWALWSLGRGEYEPFGPKSAAVRPANAPKPVPRRASRLLAEIRKPDAPPPPPPPTPEGRRVTARSPLLAAPRATKAKLQAYMVDRPHGPRTDDEVRTVAALYHEIAASAGLDPLLAVSQMVLETGNLMSRWSQPPHRNLAGIGVTSNDMDPDDVPKFRTWRAGVVGHVGRLLAYAIPLGAETAVQRALILKALEARPLGDDKRGLATSPQGLAGVWAADPDYAKKISRLANEILNA
jgi:hypothetical protein